MLRRGETLDCEQDGVGGAHLTFADVITNGWERETPDDAGNEPARAVGACPARKPPGLGTLTCEWHRARHRVTAGGYSASYSPARQEFATSECCECCVAAKVIVTHQIKVICLR